MIQLAGNGLWKEYGDKENTQTKWRQCILKKADNAPQKRFFSPLARINARKQLELIHS